MIAANQCKSQAHHIETTPAHYATILDILHSRWTIKMPCTMNHWPATIFTLETMTPLELHLRGEALLKSPDWQPINS